MMSTDDRLVYMANQIATALSRQSSGDAIDATWDHLWHFWDPRMRERIVTHLSAGGAGLSEVARGAVALLASGRTPQSSTLATQFASTRNPEDGSDAG